VHEAAALAAVQKSTILLRENRPAEALIAAKKAVALQPENLLARRRTGVISCYAKDSRVFSTTAPGSHGV
jgi:hypothetical protein